MNLAPKNKELAKGFGDVWEMLESEGMGTMADCIDHVEKVTGERPERLNPEAEAAVEAEALAGFDGGDLADGLLGGDMGDVDLTGMTDEQRHEVMQMMKEMQ